MTPIEGRRKSLYGTTGMKFLDISIGADVLPLIEKYTTGDFYLSDFSVAFKDEYDVLMFTLAYNK